jgi:bifunctional UDP-N-acetylglucosamine pyrophosphorylase / glucosamine-1-phosphate N-acetyltransferase
VERVLVVPAAGSGSRLGANVPKLLVPVNGRPMIARLLALYEAAAGHAVVIVSPAAQASVAELLRPFAGRVSLAVQDTPTGMLDAILLARPAVAALRPRRVLITWCDQVAITPDTVRRLVEASRGQPEPALVLPTCRSSAPYVHLARDAGGRIVRVLHRREGDAMPPSGESDAGVFDLSAEAYLDLLPRYAAAPEIGARTGERNFVPFVAWVGAHGAVRTVPCAEPEEAIGINTPAELTRLEAHLRAREER